METAGVVAAVAVGEASGGSGVGVSGMVGNTNFDAFSFPSLCCRRNAIEFSSQSVVRDFRTKTQVSGIFIHVTQHVSS